MQNQYDREYLEGLLESSFPYKNLPTSLSLFSQPSQIGGVSSPAEADEIFGWEEEEGNG